ncbi:MAG: hypothetical protein ACRD0J_12270 [Acidimicrobiales bacterium]
MTIMGGGGSTAVSDASKGAPRIPSEWPTKAAESLENVVGAVRARSVKPLQTIARAIVFGVVAAVMGAVLLIFGAIGILRLLNVYAFPGQEWASYLVVGGLFTIAGVFLLSLARSRPKR